MWEAGRITTGGEEGRSPQGPDVLEVCQGRCDFFECMDEKDQLDIEDAKTAASSLNPRRSKSPKREAPAAALAVASSVPCQSWSRVSIQSSKDGEEKAPIIQIDED